MEPSRSDSPVEVWPGDCLDVMATMDEAGIDAVVTDPPYELGFMGRSWDSAGAAYDVNVWLECLRLLKPGGHLLAFGGTRTYHRMACAIEDAGFDIRDSLHWIYGSGFPKSLDVSKAIDKGAGVDREDKFGGALTRFAGPTGNKKCETCGKWLVSGSPCKCPRPQDAPVTEDAARWEGWGTALKPAHEPIVVARKPLAGTVAQNVLQHGTGALNVDGCRVGSDTITNHSRGRNTAFPKRPGETTVEESGRSQRQDGISQEERSGRWPPNILLTHSAECNGDCAPACPVAEMDAQSGTAGSGSGQVKVSSGRKSGDGSWNRQDYGMFDPGRENTGIRDFGDSGGASRFFPCFRYQAKAPSSERPRLPDGSAWPTVKPLELMRWLVRLVTPPGGTVLDCFAGTGTTGQAAALEGFRCILIERDPVALELIKTRLGKPAPAGQDSLF